ncbi:helix-turn-helix transcriptional regulator [Tenggerimyces flavus]|uniref:LuxR C-terminal-related transcriptional regulator n=1 Tax=Tenggerimyces flavus TaxID=1708749 RepID=A0ABV7YHR0_9ACTN|nr:helix-turn-helix transcriptional regulator [Tenggerimyces flavus]MBM7787227.1 DNA-binding CsgD family transcriptional regulator [Tenggerimyces flavus]
MLERVERLCAGTLDAKSLRERVLAEVRRAVPFDAQVWVLTDPVTRVGTSPLADVPGLSWPDLPDLIRWRYLAESTRWTTVMDAGASVRFLHETDGTWHDPAIVDVATVVFHDRFGCWAWLDLWRTTPFASAERALLDSFVRPVTEGLRRAQARTFLPGSMTPHDGPSVLVLGPDLHVRQQTSAAVETLHRLNPPDDPIPAIPAAAYNVAAALVSASMPAWSRVHLGGGRWATLRASRLSEGGDLAVSIETCTPAERLEVFALAHGLSGREREVLAELCTGADTRQLARTFVLSEHTVNDHVKAILAKTGSATRGVLLSRIAGTG